MDKARRTPRRTPDELLALFEHCDEAFDREELFADHDHRVLNEVDDFEYFKQFPKLPPERLEIRSIEVRPGVLKPTRSQSMTTPLWSSMRKR